jgi:hypothetical protein
MLRQKQLIVVLSGVLAAMGSRAGATNIPAAIQNDGLIAYYDATAISSDAAGTTPQTTIGGTIGNIANQAASGTSTFLTQSIAADQPTLVAGINGQNAIRFNGTSDYLTSALSSSQFTNNSFTFYIVGKSDGFAGNDGTTTGGGLTSVLRFQTPSANYIVYPYTYSNSASTLIVSSDGGVGSGISGGNISSGLYVAASAIYQGNSTTNGMQTYLNGVLQNQRTTGAGALPSETLDVGAYLGNGDIENTNGDIEAILVFNTALSPTQRQAVDSYLATTYPVPEPTGCVLIGIGTFLLARRHRR